MSPKHPYLVILDAVDADDTGLVERVLRDHPEMREFKVPGVGGTWLHHAAAYGSLRMVQEFVKIGFDINSTDQRDGNRPIDAAAQRGRPDNVSYFLSQGSILDTSSSAVNPLFAAILGKSTEVVRLLLDHGIDASVRYTVGWKNMDALAFASMWGEMEIAEMIADHLAGGDSEKKRALLGEALATAQANVEPVPPHGGCPDLSEDDD